MPRSDLTRKSPHELGKWALSPAVHLPLQAQTGGLTRGQNSGRPEKRLGQKHPTMAHQLFSQEELRVFSCLCQSNCLCWMSVCATQILNGQGTPSILSYPNVRFFQAEEKQDTKRIS